MYIYVLNYHKMNNGSQSSCALIPTVRAYRRPSPTNPEFGPSVMEVIAAVRTMQAPR